MVPENYSPKINPRNKKFADKLRELSSQYSIIGVVDVTNMPAPQFQKIRKQITGRAEVVVVKKTIINLILNELESSKPGITNLLNKLDGVVGLIFTNENPFKLYKFLNDNKSSAPAKAGSISPKEIVVEAGPTEFAPGPIIGELGALGIKAGVNQGKVEVKSDAVVANEGDEISEQLATILGRLGIEPMEVGLNIKAIYEDGVIYGRDVLEVDQEETIATLSSAATEAFKLSVELEHYTSENIEYFLSNSGRDSMALAVGIEHPAPEVMDLLISKANAQMSGLALKLPENVRPAGIAVAAAPVASGSNSSGANEESSQEDNKKDDNDKETDVAEGLGSLF